MIKRATGLPAPTIVSQALASIRGVLASVALFSALINVLALTGSLFMLQVYDRVLASRSVPTLVALSIITIGLYAIQGGLEIIRSRVLVRVGCHVEQSLGERVYKLVLRLPLKTRLSGDGMQPVRDLDTVRSFLSGPGPAAILDMPWLPIYLGFVYILHPLLGLLATFGAVVLVGLTIATELLSRAPSKAASIETAARFAQANAGRRNAEVLEAMGFGANLTSRWLATNERYLAAQRRASDVIGGLASSSRVFRAILQSAILGLGAYLVIIGEVSAGAIIASSITSSRALAPIETAIGNWKAFVAARQSPAAPRGTVPRSAARGGAARSAGTALCPDRRGRRRQRTRADRRRHRHECQLRAEGGRRGRHHRPERRRQVDARPRAGGRLADPARHRSGSTARRSINGRPRLAVAMSAICRRTSSSSTARSPTTSRGSRTSPIRRRSSRRPASRMSTT